MYQKGKKNKKSKNDLKKNDDSNFNEKMQALMMKLPFTGKPKVIDLTDLNLFPELLTEYKSVCAEEEK